MIFKDDSDDIFEVSDEAVARALLWERAVKARLQYDYEIEPGGPLSCIDFEIDEESGLPCVTLEFYKKDMHCPPKVRVVFIDNEVNMARHTRTKSDVEGFRRSLSPDDAADLVRRMYKDTYI